MRATSERRTARPRGSRYAGDPGRPVVRERRDYAGDGPAFICDRCGARVSAHFRRHRAGGGRAEPWNVCGAEADVAEGRYVLPNLTDGEAAARQLVTTSQIASRWKVPAYRIASWSKLPEPVAVNRDHCGTFLYSAREVELLVRECRPFWALPVLRKMRGK